MYIIIIIRATNQSAASDFDPCTCMHSRGMASV